MVDAMPSFPGEIAGALRESGATVLVSVPVHYRVLRTVPLGGHSLRCAFSSAGMLDASDSLQFHDETGVGITEVYGSTETGGIALRNRSADGPCWHAFGVVDWKIEGELLHVRSPFLSPEMEQDADGFVATGDRVEAAGTSSFDLLGRMDGIVKVGGKRVDLREVLEKLKGLEGVSDAYVTALPVGTGRQQEVAALVVTEHVDDALKGALEASWSPRPGRDSCEPFAGSPSWPRENPIAPASRKSSATASPMIVLESLSKSTAGRRPWMI